MSLINVYIEQSEFRRESRVVEMGFEFRHGHIELEELMDNEMQVSNIVLTG